MTVVAPPPTSPLAQLPPQTPPPAPALGKRVEVYLAPLIVLLGGLLKSGIIPAGKIHDFVGWLVPAMVAAAAYFAQLNFGKAAAAPSEQQAIREAYHLRKIDHLEAKLDAKSS